MNDGNKFEEIGGGAEETEFRESERKTDNPPSQSDSSLEALVNQEQNVARRKLQKELGREPTQEEIDRWLQAHTESY
jgi:DNA-directed RNA polymerase specialized sigma subunit